MRRSIRVESKLLCRPSANARCLAFVRLALGILLCTLQVQCGPIEPGKLPDVGSALRGEGKEWEGVPAQPGATERLLLQSNENCDYYVDGVQMIRGKRVRLLVTKANHQIVCKPEGYRGKEENIQPPFNPTHPIGFTFLIEDKLPGSSPGGGPPPLPPPPQPLVQIQIVIIEPQLGRGIE